ncbi:hypothetical protein [Frigoribacterium sp. VKM Ac-2530]|uniref:hypothetical protein n=1 Tax=Frigoribacterium sp. VKM Ac-2530 TaxID=2783822 RepID=UPI001889CFE0|nr:hypothetical protein [Frigoribacterium sp. VKM Ac-2530]MBF4578407.1 hypothetical protein [Frigoribacterium sp. VKM Ac-2530]
MPSSSSRPARRPASRPLGDRPLDRLWRRVAVATTLCVAAGTLALGAPASAAPPAVTVLAQGADWSVTPAAGGFVVTKTLDVPVEQRSAAPTLWADGVELGVATQSLDGLTLTVVTAAGAAATASSVELGWSGEADPAGSSAGSAQRRQTAPAPTPVPDDEAASRLLDADPTALGAFATERLDYDLGDEAAEIRGFGRLGEMRASVTMPVGAAGERPVVMYLHGRHTSCSGGTRNPLAWPCSPDQVDVESWLGYQASAEVLASQGYAVVSISANAINALDGTLSDDNGAVARAQLILDHLALLEQANTGTAPGLSPALAGRLDLDHVGLMGHSRGGDGAVRAALLNAELPEPFGIEAVLPLAPTDFGRMTLPDVPMAVVLPYCDGDVSNLQGQHFFDDSRLAYGDDVLRSSVLVMGTNHNFFNTTWTPSKYAFSASDDWAAQDRQQLDPDCGYGTAPARLSDDEQYAAGTAYLSAFFRLTMGGEEQFLPMFDGSDEVPASAGRADVRVTASQPASTRLDVQTFATPDPAVRVAGAGTYSWCASLAGRPVPGTQPYCATSLLSAQVPDFTPANFAPSVPTTPSLRFTWTEPASATAAPAELRVPMPGGSTDVTGFEQLSFRVSPDETVAARADLVVTLVDGQGGSASLPASEFGDALQVLPGTRAPLRKMLMQQLEIPVASFAGVDLADVREVRFTAPRVAGGALLSDLSFLGAPTVGTAAVSTRPFLSVPDVSTEEGDGLGSVDVPVLLSRASDAPTTAWFSAIGTPSGKVDVAMRPLTFAPGETCKVVTVPTTGDHASSPTATTRFRATISNTQEGSTIGDSFGWVTVREDDAVVTPATPAVPAAVLQMAPAVGVQGDACAEAQAEAGTLTVSDDVVQQGQSLTISGSGYRVGEAVAVTIAPEADPAVGAPTVSVVDAGERLVETVIADSAGSFALVSAIAPDAPEGVRTVSALGAGSGLVATASYRVGSEAVVPVPGTPAAPGEPVVPGAGSGAGGAAPVVPAASGATPIGAGSGASASGSDLAYTGPGLVTGVLLALALALLGLGTAAVLSRRRASLAPALVTGSPRERVPGD